MRPNLFFACLSLVLLCAACSTPTKESAREVLNRHVAHTEAFYDKYRGLNLADRVSPAPPQLIDYMLKDNVEQGFSEKPESVTPPAEVMADIRDAIAELPPVVQRVLSKKLAGVFVVKDLGGSAYTDEVFSPEHKAVGGFVVLDVSATDRKANEWLSWKENSVFKADPAYTLHAEIEGRKRDSRRYAIQFILLHEFGHVLSIGENLSPSWSDDPAHLTHVEQFPYFAQSWRPQAPQAPATRWQYISLFDGAMPERTQMHYYQPEKTVLTVAQMPDLYGELEKTSFATLYGATNPYDDFAEAFATYVHEVLLKQHYRVTISKGGKKLKTFTSSWSDPRLHEKRAILEEFLKQQGGGAL